MRIESKLCHISENKAVVKVNGWMNGQNLGSALAEGLTVEIAEEKAMARLNKRISDRNSSEENKNNTVKSKISSNTKDQKRNTDIIDSTYKKKEPNDWSNDLSAIDLEISRLNWSRNDEQKFLENKFGYNNRNKITKYDELINYLDMLKKLENNDISNSNKYDKYNLIEESEKILKELAWDHNKGREFLKKEFNVSTRMDLDKNQLFSFLDKLKSIRNNYLSQ